MEQIFAAFVTVLSPEFFIWLVLGVFLGLVVGAIPGINDVIAIAVLIPITFNLDPAQALLMLAGLYTAACYGGSFPAIMLRIPGTASSMVTVMDGYPMTLKGEGGLALGISTISSVLGGLFSATCLMFFAPTLASYALYFGPAEYFSLGVLGLSTVAGMAGKNAAKTLVACLMGLLLSTVGMSPESGFPRFVGNYFELLEGIPFVAALIGLFGVSSGFQLMEKLSKNTGSTASVGVSRLKLGRTFPSFSLFRRILPVIGSSSLLGTIIGILPGAGQVMAIYMSYDLAKAQNKDREFGTGVPEGVAAPEAANNAVVGGSMVPLLSLGVPGNGTSALFLGALMIHGLRPGPTLFSDPSNIAYVIIVGFFLSNFLLGPMGLFLGRVIARFVFAIPDVLLGAAIVILCVTGAFAAGNSTFYILVALFFGVCGFLMEKLGIPLAPLILALILGPMMETGFTQSMTISGHSYAIFVEQPISLCMLIVSLAFCLIPLFGAIRRRHSRYFDMP
ncbi:tripartite tricarboxylate transporter permease [Mailhella massiliensis]|uniref:Tripartite tricarboxylate transporter permease n=1 Tax=Mailhella massiliensis TaxID=1903261 RepID=A0A921AVJ0_9BACT|nr:tripartite tricarboxylate transporter permease [Mailhella massiliensis]HJD96523.1 tripartite tricarboxylate transporter permease [Mailhella massiliensis]